MGRRETSLVLGRGGVMVTPTQGHTPQRREPSTHRPCGSTSCPFEDCEAENPTLQAGQEGQSSPQPVCAMEPSAVGACWATRSTGTRSSLQLPPLTLVAAAVLLLLAAAGGGGAAATPAATATASDVAPDPTTVGATWKTCTDGAAFELSSVTVEPDPARRGQDLALRCGAAAAGHGEIQSRAGNIEGALKRGWACGCGVGDGGGGSDGGAPGAPEVPCHYGAVATSDRRRVLDVRRVVARAVAASALVLLWDEAGPGRCHT